METNDKGELLGVNPQTGRDARGRFTHGNTFAPAKRSPREITTAIRAIAADNKVTEESLKLLLSVVKDKTGQATISEKLKAATFLMNQFSISAEKDVDREIAEEGNKSLAEMFEALKAMQK